MGRSVSAPSNAVVVYDSVEMEDSWEWDDYVDDLRYQVRQKYPSMQSDDGWLGREDRVLASNSHAYFGVSEYCGLVSIWLVARHETTGRYGYSVDLDGKEGLAESWVASVAPGFMEAFGSMVKDGSMSNGQGVYVAKAGNEPPAEDIAGDSGHVVINGMLCG